MTYQGMGRPLIMMDLNQFCHFSFMCFMSPLIRPEYAHQSCKFYRTSVPDLQSAVLDVTERIMDAEMTHDCFSKGPLHTFLARGPEVANGSRYFYFPRYNVNPKQIIVVDQVHPVKRFCFDEKRIEALTLTVVRTKIDFPWDWLDCFHFMMVRFENATILAEYKYAIDTFLLNEHLVDLTFLNGDGIDPWHDLSFKSATNLSKLVINGYNIPTLRNRIETEILQSLKRLDLQNNQIEFLGPESFAFMPELREINLAYNLLKNLEGLHIPNVQMLNLEGNPLESGYETCKFLKATEAISFKKKNEICPNSSQLESPLAVHSSPDEQDGQTSIENFMKSDGFSEIQRIHSTS
ncbi:uncharacterized protein LOC141850289 [Brevipalpus obovatus]|uniref:uncharacterized protein LOC141850289 n=1 Tax=Brevipalpus obovatus TaxID=246614 RepID=UPI003D9F595A